MERADAPPAQRERARAVVDAVVDIARPQFIQRTMARHACAVGLAVEGPVVKHGELPVARRIHVDLDRIGAEPEGLARS